MADHDYHWTDHVRMAAVFALLPAMAFIGPLTAILGLAIVLFALPEDESSNGNPTGTA
ncbi:hypothetical protein [Natrinema sp. SYSU A 869]|uniref:hypothetical protein n=1 Tax=Natrinema sp. SYSU A 869 TaxID=2871694 RepID=UPI001CA43962|nr:hypothetical protein [Natrinema sp. SYSU A 869]